MANNVQVVISAQDSASSVMGRLSQRFGELNRDVDKTTARFTQMNSALSALGGALSIGALAGMTKSFIDAGLQVEKLNKLFSAAAGSANLGGREFDYIRGLSEKMGLSIQDTAQSYGKFMAAIRGTTLEGEAGRKVFESVSGASTALGLSADETSGIFNALQQMMSKGKVQAEELRGQLGERLPGAFKMAADAMGVTTAQLDKMLQDGKVLASDLLPKLAVELDKTYGSAAAEGAKSASAEINRLNNALFETSATAGAALIPVFTDVVKAIKPALQMFQSFIGGFQMLAVEAAAVPDKLAALRDRGLFKPTASAQAQYEKRMAEINGNVDSVKADIFKRFSISGGDYTLAERTRQQGIKPAAAAGPASKSTGTGKFGWSLEDDLLYKNMQKFREMQAAEQSDIYQLHLQDKAKMDQEASDTYQLVLQDQAKAFEASTQAMSDRYQEVLMEQQEAYDNSPWAGLKAGIDDYARSVKSVGDMYRDLSIGAMQQATEALTQFVTTGKMNFKDLADSIISDLVRIQMRMMVSGIFNQISGFIGGMMAGGGGSDATAGGTVGSGGAYTGTSIYGQIAGMRASGGPVSGGSSYLVGERGPEIFTPGASGMITPNSAMGGNMNLTVNVVNQSGQQVKAKEGGTSFDGKSMVKTIILEAMDTDPQFRWAMRGAQ